jgi:cytidylate kinase
MVIAIDGPAGAGKSTVARRIAQSLKMQYLDTGAMYRAFTYYVLQHNVSLDDTGAIKKLLKVFNITFNGDRVFIHDDEVTNEIRSDPVTENVSYISSLGLVRKKMVELQRDIGKNRNIVAEGRDIGTVVFPYTKFKFYLDATIEERAKRRIHDKKNQSNITEIDEVKRKIHQRDAYDSTREISPLKKAPDAHYIDTTQMTIDEVCNHIISKVNEVNEL